MAETTDIATHPSQAGTPAPQRRERVWIPPVDIWENDDGVILLADLPGVPKERLTLQVEQNALVIEGEAQFDLPEGIQALYADVRSTHYRRRFTLSGELDSDGAEAHLNNGVLTLRIPKRAKFRPRRIEVQAS
ncbi:Hsp20/alpha crystallin family protein [Candidatus Methylocalor cossyra]|uniref:Hsp20/alpha crystallin family protein n=1 Tax=Candidatus Methylocalor cossyra TaxID=3108543 RepID=A0ABP1C4M5_9GAMM